MDRMGRLTQKRESFCNYYIECGGNASQAYRRAFDAGRMKDETINKRASELLADGEITGRIKKLQGDLKMKSDITKERVLEELDAILDAKISDYVMLVTEQVTLRKTGKDIEEGRQPETVEVQKLVFKDFDRLTERQLKAVESIKQGRNGIELRLHGKSWTIERICKMLGYDAPERFEGKLVDTRMQGSPLNDIPVETLKKIRRVVRGDIVCGEVQRCDGSGGDESHGSEN